jgi:hypothetical protein
MKLTVNIRFRTIVIGLILLLVGLMCLSFFQQTPQEASASRLPFANVASSSVSAVVGTTSVVVLFNTNNKCSARIISTVGAPIMLSFSTSTADALRNQPNATYGIEQLASTTVAYDSALYGCGVVTAFGYPLGASGGGSSTITLLETK